MTRQDIERARSLKAWIESIDMDTIPGVREGESQPWPVFLIEIVSELADVVERDVEDFRARQPRAVRERLERLDEPWLEVCKTCDGFLGDNGECDCVHTGGAS